MMMWEKRGSSSSWDLKHCRHFLGDHLGVDWQGRGDIDEVMAFTALSA